MKKIALVHDYIKEYGGAERVLETLHEMYPHAPVFTLVYCPQFLGPHRKRFEKWDIKTSPLNDIPFKEKFISMYRLFAPWVFKIFNFSGYDVIIVSSTGAYSPNMIRKKQAKQICYCHTPPRYLYGYATAREWKKNLMIRIIAEIANHILRMVDFKAAQNVDVFVANSEEVKARIQKFYRKDAVVVYPPVSSSSKQSESRSNTVNSSGQARTIKKYYLAGGRLARPKHFDLIIQAANELKLPLKIFGKGFAGYGEELQALAYGKDYSSSETRSQAGSSSRVRSNNIQFVGEVTDEEKSHLMKNAKAFFMASEDEDFGIVPVESMGEGTPVIAYKSGGVKETVIDGKTGVFFEELTVKSIKDAVKRLETLRISSSDCIKQAQKFSRENFEKGIRKVVSSV